LGWLGFSGKSASHPPDLDFTFALAKIYLFCLDRSIYSHATPPAADPPSQRMTEKMQKKIKKSQAFETNKYANARWPFVRMISGIFESEFN